VDRCQRPFLALSFMTFTGPFSSLEIRPRPFPAGPPGFPSGLDRHFRLRTHQISIFQGFRPSDLFFAGILYSSEVFKRVFPPAGLFPGGSPFVEEHLSAIYRLELVLDPSVTLLLDNWLRCRANLLEPAS